MTKEIIIIALVIALIYLYYQQQKQPFTGTAEIVSEGKEFAEDLGQNISTIQTFLKEQLNSNDLQELKTKLGEKTLNELLEENEDYETEVDTLTRTKESLEQDLTTQSTAFQARQREKDRELKKLKEDLTNLEKRHSKQTELLTSEKQQHKGSLERITKLTEQITELEKQKQELTNRPKSPLPGEFPEADPTNLVQVHQDQLKQINLLFDSNVKDDQPIDFNSLYALLETVAQEQKKKKQ